MGGKYSFVNRTIRHWNQLPAEAPAIFSSWSHIFRKRVRKVIIIEVKWSEGVRSEVMKRLKVEGSEKWRVKCCAVQWSEVKVNGGTYYHWFIFMQFICGLLYNMLSDCYLICVFCSLLCSNYSFMFLLFVLCLFSCFVCFACYFMCSLLIFCFVYCLPSCT